MKKLISIIILIIFYQTSSQAGQYSDKFANCLMQKTTDRDKIVLVRWAFSALAHHSALRDEFNIPKSKFTKHEIAVADEVLEIPISPKTRRSHWEGTDLKPNSMADITSVLSIALHSEKSLVGNLLGLQTI